MTLLQDPEWLFRRDLNRRDDALVIPGFYVGNRKERKMALTARLSPEKDLLTVQVSGRFDFTLHREFRAAYRDLDADIRYVIDMSATEYMDSSALGMLLLLREHAGGDAARISIVRANAEIKRIFSISNFDRLFQIE